MNAIFDSIGLFVKLLSRSMEYEIANIVTTMYKT